MAEPLPTGPDEAANRARVQAIAQGGMQAAQQAPSIATAPEAMQTAMARSAGIAAPSQFNATQVATIQNPFTRGDAQLTADQAGAGGVLGSINSSTADYMEKARGGLNIQQEITRRTYQQLAQQHELEARQYEVDRINAETAYAEANALKDPTSPAARLKLLTEENAYKKALRDKEELDAPKPQTTASSPGEITARTGMAATDQSSLRALPQYNDLLAVVVPAQGALNYTQFESTLYRTVQSMIGTEEGGPVEENGLTQAQAAGLLDLLKNEYGGTMTGGYAAPQPFIVGSGAQGPMTAPRYGDVSNPAAPAAIARSQSPVKESLWGRFSQAPGPAVQAAIQAGAAPAPVYAPKLPGVQGGVSDLNAAALATLTAPPTVKVSKKDAKRIKGTKK